MIIKEMSASYGALNGESLKLSPGLNVISAPNESGKSTWCSFIKNMLYGVDSAAREKGGVKPDKLRYAPWSGQAMSGSMEIESEGESISLSRTGKEAAPMRAISAVYTGTGEQVPGLTGAVGEQLLGVSQEVFERSAFIGQGSVPVSANPELEKRIAAIVQTGDEGASYTDAEEKLRAAQRSRRHNRTGRLPEIERKLESLQASFQDIETERERAERLRAARDTAIARRDELAKKVAESREKQRKHSLESLSESRERVKALEAACEKSRNESLIAEQELRASRFGMEDPKTVRTAAARAIDEASALRKKAMKGGPISLNILMILLPFFICIYLLFLDPFRYIPTALCGVLALAATVRLIVIRRKRSGLQGQIMEIYARYGAASPEEVWDAVDGHVAAFERYGALCEECDALQLQLANERRKQEAADRAIVQGLDFTASGSESAVLTKQLEEAEAALRRLREELAESVGRISAMGAGEDTSEKIAALTQEHKKLTQEYNALALAAETLKEAGVEIQNRMTPRLSARASEIFSQLTDGRYDAVALDRELRALSRLSGDTVSREAAFLSVGALDQLYLAVRLAICELALPEEKACPVILDDALGSFDDGRCRAALEFLREFAKTRQVILFSCHGREAQMMSTYPDVNIVKIP